MTRMWVLECRNILKIGAYYVVIALQANGTDESRGDAVSGHSRVQTACISLEYRKAREKRLKQCQGFAMSSSTKNGTEAMPVRYGKQMQTLLLPHVAFPLDVNSYGGVPSSVTSWPYYFSTHH